MGLIQILTSLTRQENISRQNSNNQYLSTLTESQLGALNQLLNSMQGNADIGSLTPTPPQTAPTAPAVVASSTVGVLNGAYRYAVILITGYKKSDGTYNVAGFCPSAETASVTITNKQSSLSAVSVGTGAAVIGRAIYRTASGGAAGTEQFCGIIWDNTTTTYTDNLADASLGTGMPTVSGTAIPASVPTRNTTGTPIYLPNGSTAQTPASGDNSKNIATSEFVHATLLSALKSASGWLKDPTTGIYLQWGNVYLTTSSTQFNYPIGFPNVCFQIIGSNGSAFLDFYLTNFTKNAFQGIANGAGGINYLAVGY